MRFIYDKKVYYIDKEHFLKNGKTEDCIEELYQYLCTKGGSVFYVGDKMDLGDEKFNYSIINENILSCTDLERCVAEFPRKLTQLVIPANIYEVKAK